MRLSGWQRIGVVASVVWALYGAYWGNELGLHEGHWAEIQEDICAAEPHGDLNAWEQQFNKDWEAATQYHWYYAAFVGLVPIPLAWLTAFGAIRLIRWIQTGFNPSARQIVKRRATNDRISFEPFFHSFVEWFGGTVLQEAPEGKTADYLFKKYNVIAELKTMLEDSTFPMNEKVKIIISEWMTTYHRFPTHTSKGGNVVIELGSTEPEIARKWINLLRQQIERLVSAANSQIADTKRRENLPDARGILLISNTSNLYHNDPKGFGLILGNLLSKVDSKGALRYPDIQGAVYFSSKDVKSVNEDMYFWCPLQMKRTPDEDVSDIVAFQRDLQQGWYRFITEATGTKIRQHWTD